MANFEPAIRFVLDHEGGEVNDPNDPGGHTKFGISKRAHPEVDIASLTVEKAKNLYFNRYWLPLKGDALPEFTALALLDWYVHSGGWAVKGIQQLVRVRADGDLGSITLAAIERATPTPDHDRHLAEQLCVKRCRFAGAWIKQDPFRRAGFASGFMVRFVDLVAAFTVEDLDG